MLASPLFYEMPVLGLDIILALILGDVGLVQVLRSHGGEWFGNGRCNDTDGGHG